eukprot:399171_1
MSSIEEALSKAQNYFINVAKYSLEQAKQLTIACNDNEFKNVDDIIKDFKGEFDHCALIGDSAFISMFPNIKDRQKLFIDIQYALNIKESQSSINIEEKQHIDDEKDEKKEASFIQNPTTLDGVPDLSMLLHLEMKN